jgi:hypothetical protein
VLLFWCFQFDLGQFLFLQTTNLISKFFRMLQVPNVLDSATQSHLITLMIPMDPSLVGEQALVVIHRLGRVAQMPHQLQDQPDPNRNGIVMKASEVICYHHLFPHQLIPIKTA